MILIFDEEDLKTQKLSSEARSLQTLKNNMIRVIGLRVVQCVNTKYAKTEKKNQNDDCKPNGCLPHNSKSLQCILRTNKRQRCTHQNRHSDQCAKKANAKFYGFHLHIGAKLFNRLKPKAIIELYDNSLYANNILTRHQTSLRPKKGFTYIGKPKAIIYM